MKISFSKEELNFVREGILKGVRVDLRKVCDTREIEIVQIKNEQSDGSCLVVRGHTKVKVSIQFKESVEGLIELGLIQEGAEEPFEVEKIPLSIYKQIKNWLMEFKIGLRIECEVDSDDGNVYGSFLCGLFFLLRHVQFPDINDLEKTIESGLLLPDTKVVAFFGETLVWDPLKLEEESCDFSVTVVGEQNKIRNIWMSKCGEMNVEQLNLLL